ncbi:hypothetical protein [Thioalkalivibrio sp. HK1]|uniref:hypothetical protein n=1 Tax=Thioalkalivibrio sp. HK1 TaxID=1469245 RepID=UPI0012DDD22F|nr:hypothetical protein [Thioalkalivibrio sp. HK1]
MKAISRIMALSTLLFAGSAMADGHAGLNMPLRASVGILPIQGGEFLSMVCESDNPCPLYVDVSTVNGTRYHGEPEQSRIEPWGYHLVSVDDIAFTLDVPRPAGVVTWISIRLRSTEPLLVQTWSSASGTLMNTTSVIR